MASDNMSGQPCKGVHGFTPALSYDTVDDGRKIFDAMDDSGRVEMPLQTTFWAEGFGMLVDRYGTPWMVNCGQSPA